MHPVRFWPTCLILVVCSSVALLAQERADERPAWVEEAMDEAKALFDAGKFEQGVARCEAAARKGGEKGTHTTRRGDATKACLGSRQWQERSAQAGP